MPNRKALEEAVYHTYRDMEMPIIQRMPDTKLQWLLDEKRSRRDKEQSPQWDKIETHLEVRDGLLTHVERWQVVDEQGSLERDYFQACGERVFYEGRWMSSSIVRHFLQTGEWVRRVPKPRKHRAVVRVGKKTVHLGYFSTIEERNAAVFAWKIGIKESC